jgi:hypothetical protein
MPEGTHGYSFVHEIGAFNRIDADIVMLCAGTGVPASPAPPRPRQTRTCTCGRRHSIGASSTVLTGTDPCAPCVHLERAGHAWPTQWSVQLHQRPHRRRPRLHFRPPPPWPVRLAAARAPILRLFDAKVGSTTRAHTHAPSLCRYVQTYIRHMHALPAWSTRTHARTHRHRSMWAPCVHLERGPVASVPQTGDGESRTCATPRDPQLRWHSIRSPHA